MPTLGERLPLLTTELPGPASRALVDRLSLAESPAFTARRARRAEQSGSPQDPIAWRAASGANVVDADGNILVDLTAGFGVALLGHGHPDVVAAVTHQTCMLLHALGDVHPSDVKVQLLERLCALAPWPARAALCLSGSDALEAALKTALLATGRPGIVAFEGGYHGLGHGPLAACGYGEGFRAPFAAALNPHVRFAPYPHPSATLDAALAAVARAFDELPGRVGAVLIEPIQGRGGVHVPPAGFVAEVGELARARGALLIVDEIYTGLGRTGVVMQHVSDGAEADIICLGKTLGGGLPVSACIGRQDVMAAWGDPAGEAIHTSTFAGNPLGCAAALAALEVLARDNVAARAAERGAALRRALSPIVTARGGHVRGKGLLLGVHPGPGIDVLALGRALLSRGYLVLGAGSPADVLCLTPPVCLTDAQISGFAQALAASLASCA